LYNKRSVKTGGLLWSLGKIYDQVGVIGVRRVEMSSIGKWLTIFLLALTLGAAPADVTGRWKVVYSGPGMGPKTVGSMILDLRVDGSTVNGTVVIGVWPGEAPIADGKVEGDHITFNATGHLSSTTGIPTCAFDVTMEGDEMHVTFKAVKNGGGPVGTGEEFRYTGRRKVD
jgi:hypothetical protein